MGYFNFPSLCSGKSLYLNLIYASPVTSSNSIARPTFEAEIGVKGNETALFSSIQLYSGYIHEYSRMIWSTAKLWKKSHQMFSELT
jgi:hypothetical protein